MVASKYAALEAQLLDATQGGDLLRVRAPSRRAEQRRGRRHLRSSARHALCSSARRARAPAARLALIPPLLMTLRCGQMHRLLLNNTAEGLVNAAVDGGARTALHVAVERGNEAAVALLLAQCVLRAHARAGACCAAAARAATDSPAPAAACPRLAAKRTPPRPTRTARARWSWRWTATRRAS